MEPILIGVINHSELCTIKSDMTKCDERMFIICILVFMVTAAVVMYRLSILYHPLSFTCSLSYCCLLFVLYLTNRRTIAETQKAVQGST